MARRSCFTFNFYLHYKLHLFCSILIPAVYNYNLDYSAPIVKKGPVRSYFGFSVAQHLQNIREESWMPRIIVGAPKSNLSNDFDSSLQRLVSPGAIYSCPITSREDDCKMLVIDDEAMSSSGSSLEGRDNQWMGVVVRSSGRGQAIACAHRWVSRTSASHHGLGKCIALTNALDESQFMEPCVGKSMERGHEEWGNCQAGMAADVSMRNKWAIGIPGLFAGRGGVAKTETIYIDLEADTEWYYNNYGEKERRDASTNLYSYLGASVKIGNLIATDTYIIGSPRSKQVGEVLIFTQRQRGQEYLQEHARLTGDQLGSGFGTAIEIIDVNGDGKQDLIVSAPFYRDKYVGGAIYVYVNDEQNFQGSVEPIKITSRKLKEVECLTLNCIDARFGFSLANAGDLDGDGFQDLAVGAPFEGQGVVYIFCGSLQGISKDYSQRIAASSFKGVTLSSFGYSLSGGFDLDENGYPDLAVGAYQSASMLILRTRPVINVRATFLADPVLLNHKEEKRCSINGIAKICFKIQACFTFRAEPRDRFSNAVALNYKMVSETFTGKLNSRAHFKETGSDELNGEITLAKPDVEPVCTPQHLLYLQESNSDFLNAIPLQLTFDLKDQSDPVQQPGGPLLDMNSYPVLNAVEAKKIRNVEFEKNCGADSHCQSNLVLSANFIDTSYEGGHPVFNVGSNRELRLSVKVVNNAEDAHSTKFFAYLPKNVNYVNIEPSGKFSCDLNQQENSLSCALANPLDQYQSLSFKIRLDLQNVKIADKTLIFKLHVNTTSTETEITDNHLNIELHAVIKTEMFLRGVSYPNEVLYGGRIRGESAIRKEFQIGDYVEHRYEVRNDGPGIVFNSTLEIWWPYEVENGFPKGKHLLYLLRPPIVDGQGHCDTPDAIVDPLQVAFNSHRVTSNRPSSLDVRTKRAASRFKIPRAESVFEGGKRINRVHLNCDDGSAKCAIIKCRIGELRDKGTVTVTLKSRLWNSTLSEDFRKVSYVLIESKGRILIDPRLGVLQNTSNDIAAVGTKATPNVKIAEAYQVSWWIILIAVIVGLLLLILFIILLRKCGFFHRKIPHDMRHQGQVEKKKKKHQDDAAYN